MQSPTFAIQSLFPSITTASAQHLHETWRFVDCHLVCYKELGVDCLLVSSHLSNFLALVSNILKIHTVSIAFVSTLCHGTEHVRSYHLGAYTILQFEGVQLQSHGAWVTCTTHENLFGCMFGQFQNYLPTGCCSANIPVSLQKCFSCNAMQCNQCLSDFRHASLTHKG